MLFASTLLTWRPSSMNGISSVTDGSGVTSTAAAMGAEGALGDQSTLGAGAPAAAHPVPVISAMISARRGIIEAMHHARQAYGGAPMARARRLNCMHVNYLHVSHGLDRGVISNRQ